MVSISSTFYVRLFVQKCFAQLLSNYSLALWLFGARISMQKLLVKCWWNWLQVKPSNSQLMSSIRIRILFFFPVPARVSFTESVQYIPRGLRGMILCHIEAEPPIDFVTWTKNKRLFDPFETPGVMALKNGSLLIDKVSWFKNSKGWISDQNNVLTIFNEKCLC